MERHYHVLNQVRNKILRMPNVVGVGVGYKLTGFKRTKRPAITILVEKKVPLSGLLRNQKLPGKIKNLETDVIEVGKIKLLKDYYRMRPAPPGSSIGHYKISAGTFGCVVRDSFTGEKLILSNNHVLANGSDGADGRAKSGDLILQPGARDGGKRASDKIGELIRFIPLRKTVSSVNRSHTTGAAKVLSALWNKLRPGRAKSSFPGDGSIINTVDCAVARPISPNAVSEEVLGLGYIRGLGEIREGMKVSKSGRSSGITTGHVLAKGVTIKVSLNDNETGWFKDQVLTDLYCLPGDSGSLIMDKENKAVGLLFAGSETHCLFNQLINVFQLLSVRL